MRRSHRATTARVLATNHVPGVGNARQSIPSRRLRMAFRPNRFLAALLLGCTLLAAGPASAVEEQKKININTAGAQELDSLRGIGPAMAQAIVSYRDSHGPFKSVEELAEVK